MNPIEQLRQKVAKLERANVGLCQTIAYLKLNEDLRSQALAAALRAVLNDGSSAYIRKVAVDVLHRYELELSIRRARAESTPEPPPAPAEAVATPPSPPAG